MQLDLSSPAEPPQEKPSGPGVTVKQEQHSITGSTVHVLCILFKMIPMERKNETPSVAFQSSISLFCKLWDNEQKRQGD